MEKFIYTLIASSLIAFVISGIFSAVYNTVIGIPHGLKIKKEKKYKTVTATRITNNSQYERDQLHENNGKNVLKYEWTVDGKTYKRRIVTNAWPLPVDTFYYLNNPKYAMPLPEELANFRYTKILFIVLFIFLFPFILNK